MGSGEKFDFLAQLEAHARASQELGDKRAEENAKKLKDSRSQNYDDIPTLESDDDIGAPGARGGGSDSGDGKDGEGSGEEEVKRKSKAWLTRKVDGVADKIESWYRFLTCKRSPVAPIEFVPNSKPGQGPEILRLENFLDLNSEDVDRLYGYFCAIDGDGSGEISIDEFCEYFNMPQTEFTERAFAVLDEDNSGAIDFKEFVVVLLSYCSFDFTSLSKFAFYLYDVDKSLMLDREEVQEMVAHVYDVPPDMIEPRILRVIELFDDDGDEKINIYEFVTHAK
uniref:EF-hand domain-containing protein n=1 Tax=Phaeomonas parva TaxID=124430 RepID=A0A6U4KLC8_9STRA|mmetsp:Transcript_43484/g.136381  ORF Transcript_43484/g.136381 Transcript_43484/m.136381 type:complete len:281 (+) Transcript_43484:263-1105(+)